MQHKDAFLLDIVVEYCDKMSRYLREKQVDFDAFLENPYHQDICSFYCLQIGEMANDLSQDFIESHHEIEWRKIINMRNMIAHEYGAIDAKILWGIILKSIPELRDFCAKQIRV